MTLILLMNFPFQRMRDFQEICAIGMVRGFVQDPSKTEATLSTPEDIGLSLLKGREKEL
jgi:hypothetical protein